MKLTPGEKQFHRRVIKAIRAQATESQITLTHLPDRAGVSRSHFWEIMAGRASPTLQWVFKVADALGVDPEGLFIKDE